ncbi:MAG: hypothetical protein BWY98_01181 [Tenericutes bacterium ADurb.BinA155]|jgi:hypothetical protein|nr:MAG: hypothetical protein BWY98_01181 [Tenericutes bacterium ADurb.BinA155]
MKNKPNLVYAVFAALASLLLAGVAVYVGITVFQNNPGLAIMDFILALMVVLGCVFLEIGEFKAGKDIRLLGCLLGYLAIVILLFTQGNSTKSPFAIIAGIGLFAYTVFTILNIYLSQKGLVIVSFVFAAICFLLLLGQGIYTMVNETYTLTSVLYFFGYFFLGIALFIGSLFHLIDLNKNDEATKA